MVAKLRSELAVRRPLSAPCKEEKLQGSQRIAGGSNGEGTHAKEPQLQIYCTLSYRYLPPSVQAALNSALLCEVVATHGRCCTSVAIAARPRAGASYAMEEGMEARASIAADPAASSPRLKQRFVQPSRSCWRRQARMHLCLYSASLSRGWPTTTKHCNLNSEMS